MTVLAAFDSPNSPVKDAQDTVWRNAIICTFAAMAVLLLPPAIYGGLVWKQFGFLKISGFIPHEAFKAAWDDAGVSGILGASLISVNMTSGLLLANMFDLTLGQLFLSLVMGSVIAWNMIAQLNLRRVCAFGGGSGAATAAGSGVLATIGASSTGIMGCCGSGALGGVLALAGVGGNTAALLSQWSAVIQVLFIIGLAANGLRLKEKLFQAGAKLGR